MVGVQFHRVLVGLQGAVEIVDVIESLTKVEKRRRLSRVLFNRTSQVGSGLAPEAFARENDTQVE